MKVAVLVPFRPGCPHREAAYATVTRWWGIAVPEWQTITVDDGGEPFSRGASLNKGVVDTDADVIVAADADLLIGRQAVLDAVELAHSAPGLVQPLTQLHWHNLDTTRILLRQPWRAFYPPIPESLYQWDVSPTTPLLGGINVLSRETWDRAGGWLDMFRGWGNEDMAFAAQCRTLAGPHRKVPGVAHHLYHPKPPESPYAAPETIARNAEALARVSAADGDPEAMAALVHG